MREDMAKLELVAYHEAVQPSTRLIRSLVNYAAVTFAAFGIVLGRLAPTHPFSWSFFPQIEARQRRDGRQPGSPPTCR